MFTLSGEKGVSEKKGYETGNRKGVGIKYDYILYTGIVKTKK